MIHNQPSVGVIALVYIIMVECGAYTSIFGPLALEYDNNS